MNPRRAARQHNRAPSTRGSPLRDALDRAPRHETKQPTPSRGWAAYRITAFGEAVSASDARRVVDRVDVLRAGATALAARARVVAVLARRHRQVGAVRIELAATAIAAVVGALVGRVARPPGRRGRALRVVDRIDVA